MHNYVNWEKYTNKEDVGHAIKKEKKKDQYCWDLGGGKEASLPCQAKTVTPPHKYQMVNALIVIPCGRL